MKITKEQAITIRNMAMDGYPNAEIAEVTGLPLSEIYAFRSKNNITRDKVRRLLSGKKANLSGAAATKSPVKMEDVLAAIICKCGGKLEAVVEYILAAAQEETVCNYCPVKSPGNCEGLDTCSAAVSVYLRGRDGHD